MKRLLSLLLLPLLAHFASALDFSSDPLEQLRPALAEAAPVPLPAPVRELTFMVFMNGKNSLNPYVDLDLNEMEAVGSGDRLAVVAQAGRLGSGVKRYLVLRDSDPGKVTSPAVQDLGRRDMGDWKELAEFVKWARAAYPAKRYALVVWNHGNGWKFAPGAAKGISYDNETHRHITTIQLGLAMRAAGPVDIFATDACLMQMAEVAYEIKDGAEVIVGSEETAPGPGFPYDKVLRSAESVLGSSTEALGAAMVSAYHAHYSEQPSQADLSAIRAAELAPLAALVREWSRAAAASPDGPAMKHAAGRAKSYDKPEYRDLRDIMRRALKATGDPLMRSRTEAVLRHLEERVVIAKGARDYAHGEDPDSGGLSVYLPTYGYVPEYFPLAWTRDSGWLDFLKVMAKSPN